MHCSIHVIPITQLVLQLNRAPSVSYRTCLTSPRNDARKKKKLLAFASLNPALPATLFVIRAVVVVVVVVAKSS